MKRFFLSAPSYCDGTHPDTQKDSALISETEHDLSSDETAVFLTAVMTEEEKECLPFYMSENEPPHSVIFFSDSEELIEAAAQRGMRTFFLPKRSFPLKDTLSVLSLSLFDTIVVFLTAPCDKTDFSPLCRDRRSLFLTHGDDIPHTVTANFPLSKDEAFSLGELRERLFGEDPDPLAQDQTPSHQTPISHLIFEWLELFALSLTVVVLLMVFFFRHSPVSGESMLPTLEPNDVLLLTQIGFTPECGDIVILQTEDDPLRPLVKRVIATSGQTVRIDFDTWEIFINGKLLEEPYLDLPDGAKAPMELYLTPLFFEQVESHHTVFEATVPENHLFVLGDNRQNSKDSRTLGFIDERDVIGEVILRLSPFSKFGAVN